MTTSKAIREFAVVAATRTAMGTLSGCLKDAPPNELAALMVKEATTRAGLDHKYVDHVVFGHVVNTESKDMHLSRVSAAKGDCGKGTPAYNVNRLCAAVIPCKPRSSLKNCLPRSAAWPSPRYAQSKERS